MSSASLRLSSSLGKVIAASSSFATTKASSHALRSPLASPSSLKQHPLVVVVPLLNNLRARRRRDVNTKAINNGMTTRNFQFSEKIQISPKHVFLETPLSFAFVNLKPVVPGHVLVCPKRVVEKYEEMTGEEISDLMLASQKVAVAVKKIHSANAMTLTIQDGPDAGQTVFHVHVHVMPRKPNDFARNDDIYEKLERCEEEERKARVDADENRKARGEEEMEKEATEIRRVLESA